MLDIKKLEKKIKVMLAEEIITLVDNDDMWIRGIHPDDIELIAINIANMVKKDYDDLEKKED